MGRTIFIGDIHGCYDELTQLLEKLRLQHDDRVVAVGDLTVKGPKSAEVLDLFAHDSRFSSVVGNHDLALVRHWGDKNNPLNKAQAKAFHELQYTRRSLLSIPLFAAFLHRFRFARGCPCRLQTRNPIGKTVIRRSGRTANTWSGSHVTRRDPWYEAYEGPATVLFGHWPAPQPRLATYAIGLDTGCVYGGRLTAYVLESGEFVSVSAAETYDSSSSIPLTQSIKSVHN